MRLLHFFESLGHLLGFAFRSFASGLTAFAHPAEVLRQMHAILVGSLPLGLVAGLALGSVVWMHLHGVVGPEYRHKVPEYLALAILLEFAPLGAGLIVAGRSGASLAAELSAMKLTEQIDALEMLGLSPWTQLVGPRVLAAMVSLPLLTVYIAFFALGASAMAEMLGGSLTWTQYQNDVMRGLINSGVFAKLVAAPLKTIVFGYLVASVGCFIGLTAHGGTEGVGTSATQGVVWSILLVLVSNVALVKVIQMFL